MAGSLTLLTDGSSSGLALARWLQGRLGEARVIEELEPRAFERSLQARKEARLAERLVAIGRGAIPRGAVDASRAFEVAAEWMRHLPPIEVRTSGARLLDERVKASSPGSKELLSLSTRLTGASARPKERRAGRRGRPPGLNPFRGAGLELCTVLLLTPGAQWTERALAERIHRAGSMVHKLIAELTRRGLVRRSKRGTQVADPELLRDDIVADWRGRIGVPRRATEFARRGPNVLAAAMKSAARSNRRCVAAGASAIRDPALRLTGRPTVYVEGEPSQALSNGFTPAPPGLGDLVVWTPPEPAVFLEPQAAGGAQGTNALITYLDLVISGDPRLEEAALAVWNRIGDAAE
jgi:hypothetical protein